MDSTHSSAVLSMSTLVPVIGWLTHWPIQAPNDGIIPFAKGTQDVVCEATGRCGRGEL